MHTPVITEQLATDADAAHELLAGAYGHGRIRFEPGQDPLFGHRRHDLGELRVDDVRYSFRTEYDMDPLGHLLILRVADGELAFEDAGGTQRLFRAGDVFLVAQPDEGYRAVTCARRAQVIGLDLSLLDQVVDEPAASVVRRFRREALSPEQAALWRRTVDYLTATLAGNDVAAASPLVLGAAGRMVTAAAVSAFTADDAEGAVGTERTAGTPHAGRATVRRAIAYMEANPDLDLGVVDIARAAHVSVRALQLAFRRELDTTPMAYLRRVRLDRVRADLLAADASPGTTITQIAARWGFADPSRFSVQYRRAFGEPPRATLRR